MALIGIETTPAASISNSKYSSDILLLNDSFIIITFFSGVHLDDIEDHIYQGFSTEGDHRSRQRTKALKPEYATTSVKRTQPTYRQR